MAHPSRALGSCCGHKIPAGELSPLLADPVSAPLWTEAKGSTQGSRGPGEAVDISIEPAGFCLGKCVAVQRRAHVSVLSVYVYKVCVCKVCVYLGTVVLQILL